MAHLVPLPGGLGFRVFSMRKLIENKLIFNLHCTKLVSQYELSVAEKNCFALVRVKILMRPPILYTYTV
jgi:hypothetical protein